jgi:hypothetical protein
MYISQQRSNLNFETYRQANKIFYVTDTDLGANIGRKLGYNILNNSCINIWKLRFWMEYVQCSIAYKHNIVLSKKRIKFNA